ncbi:50S ribosomal protein L18e [candidate division MSBL1 archaeon SCGC-AAA259I09]|uniref:Large ribosomal subunit protein eL18 n=2 Tax=candidate division MSBL1 TaxID=215777 RepID=A0A133UTL8_9EURY|nr:50S ribosomal protein L18e [candidate division MSBL1 archaeon SCGC-AAA259I09]KXA98810.1 50S ribosomal protein L18e [candidate division MSBL1 archaeon SCGC-AAA259J03]
MSGGKGPSNPILRGLIRKLRRKGREFDANIWLDLADRLARSNRKRSEVNLSQLDRYTEKGETAIVPGKVLGSGKLTHPLSVAAFSFSSRARRRIQKADGETLTITELLDKNPDGSNMTIIE